MLFFLTKTTIIVCLGNYSTFGELYILICVLKLEIIIMLLKLHYRV